jgi:hypothetical protein
MAPALAIEPKRHGVLDHPLSRMMTIRVCSNPNFQTIRRARTVALSMKVGPINITP